MEIEERLIKIKTPNIVKTKICLYDTYSLGEAHLNKRYKKYTNYPHFTVYKDGRIQKHLEYSDSPGFIDITYVGVALESLGELYEIKGQFYNSFGTIYLGEPFNREWKGKKHFDRYSEIQIATAKELCMKIATDLLINDKFAPNGFQTDNLSEYGIIYRPNLDKIHYDINPSFFKDEKTE